MKKELKKKLKGIKKPRATTGSQQRRILANASLARDQPDVLIPLCKGHCRRCPFEPVRAKLHRVQRFASDPDKLSRMAKGGLSGAYAATLLLLHRSMPYLAVSPEGIPYALRGKASERSLIGVQYCDDPRLRLYGLHDLILRKRLHVYSDAQGMVCTGRVAAPPEEFVTSSIKGLASSIKGLRGDSGNYACDHLDPKTIVQRPFVGRPYLLINWGDTWVGVCKTCGGGNTLRQLLEHVAVPKYEQVEVYAVPGIRCMGPCERCEVGEWDQRISDVDQYWEITDAELLVQRSEEFERWAKERDKLIILDGRCFGGDVDALIRDLRPSSEEAIALRAVLGERSKPLILHDGKTTAGKVLAALWPEWGKEAVYAVTHDQKLAERYGSQDASKVSPSVLLKEATKQSAQQRALERLPTYDKLPPIGQFADRVSRTYRTQGAAEAIHAIERYQAEDSRSKSVARAFLLAMGAAEGREWRYTATEREFSGYLESHARRLLEADPAGYHEALEELLQAAGCSELPKIKSTKIKKKKELGK